MSDILLRASEARDEAAHVQSEAAAAQEQMNNLRTRLNGLAASFKGQTAEAFDAAFNEWKLSADQMLSSLGELGQFLNQAATVIEDTDAQIASSLRGG